MATLCYSLAVILLLLTRVELSRSGPSRIHIGSKMETFVSYPLSGMNVDGFGKYFIDNIQEDQWIEGNILATMGNGVVTIDGNGNATVVAGSVEPSWIFHTVIMNQTSGLAQLDGGRTLIISDYWNACLRKFDRVTKNHTLFAGQSMENFEANYGSAHPICSRPQDGPAETARFCNPARLYYKEKENKIVMLDKAIRQTAIREIDLDTMHVRTLLYNFTFLSEDFLENDNFYTFTVPPGVLQMNVLTSKGLWLAGCGNQSFEGGSCSSKLNTEISMSNPMGMLNEDGVLIVADKEQNEVFIVDTVNERHATLTVSGREKLFDLDNPIAVALIGDYLYIGESTIVYGYPYSYFGDSFFINIKRIKFSISSSFNGSSDWMKRDPRPELNVETTSSNDGNSGAVVGATVGTLGGIILLFGLCCCINMRERRREARGHIEATGATAVPRLKLETVGA